MSKRGPRVARGVPTLPPLRAAGVGRWNKLILEGQRMLERIAYLEQCVMKYRALHAECLKIQEKLPQSVRESLHEFGLASDAVFLSLPASRFTAEFKRYVVEAAYWYWKNNKATKACVVRAFGVEWSTFVEWERKWIHKVPLEESGTARIRQAHNQQQPLPELVAEVMHTPSSELTLELEQLAHGVSELTRQGKSVKFVPKLKEEETKSSPAPVSVTQEAVDITSFHNFILPKGLL